MTYEGKNDNITHNITPFT